jgi:hypothetical protein
VSVPAGKVPIIESMQAAWRGALKAAPAIVPAALVGALVATGLNYLSMRTGLGGNLIGQMGLSVLSGAGVALFFAAAVLASSGKDARLGPGVLALASKLFAAMAVIGFFLLIVMVVGALPGLIMVGMIFAPYQNELAAAQNDPTAGMALFRQVFAEQGVSLLLIGLLYGLIWLAITSRLYLAAPASVLENRVASFETWRWTQGNLVRISAARLVTLAPPLIIAGFVQAIVSSLLGVNTGDPAAVLASVQANAAPFIVASFVSTAASFIVYGACEAALSAYLYRGLKPPA